MAKKRISDLTALTSLDNNDLLIAGDVSEITTKKITVANFLIQLALIFISGTISGDYNVFDFGTTAVKLKVKNATGTGYTYLTFQDGQIIASDS